MGTDMAMQAELKRVVQQYETSGGGRVFQIPLEAFPGFWGYVYLVLVDDPDLGRLKVLVDTGSGFGESNQQLEAQLQSIGDLTGEPVGLADLSHVLITHGHIDHFGGLAYVRPRTQAQVGVHELDRRILTNYEERLAVVARRLDEFLVEAGVGSERRSHILQLYLMTKSLYHSVKVDFTYEATGMRLGPFEMLHVPGHCAGHVVIRLHDVLFSGDHVLAHTSPHQSPERLTLSTGLEHYLKSLEVLRDWAQGISMTLGGHERPVTDLDNRIDAIKTLHEDRLSQTLALLAEPRTVAEVSQELFGEVHGYNVLLALEETGAHVEYLYQRGLLGIDNLQALESSEGSIPLRYYRLRD
jgi:glyoxylase-like metal-dependent hydrolase (beta-lactamase superfamily II)